jgi:hypothetical protein
MRDGGWKKTCNTTRESWGRSSTVQKAKSMMYESQSNFTKKLSTPKKVTEKY